MLHLCFIYVKDVSGVELSDLQHERCPRISANDLIKILTESPDGLVVVDLRNKMEFKRAHLKNSINIPFASVSLGDIRLNALNLPEIEHRLANRVVVVASNLHENAVLVRLELL